MAETAIETVLQEIKGARNDITTATTQLTALREAKAQEEKDQPDADALFAKWQEQQSEKLDEILPALLAKHMPAGGRPGDLGSSEAEKAHPFKSFGDFLYRAKAREMPTWQEKAWGGGGADGGYLLPEEYRAELFSMPLEDEIVRPRARIIPMTTDTVKFPSVDQSTQASSLFGGVICYWPDMATAITDKEPKFKQIELDVVKCAAATLPPYEVTADSNIGVQSLLGEMLGEAVRYTEDEAFLISVAAGQPTGIKEASCAVVVNRAVAGQVATADIANMYAAGILRGGGSVWLINQTVIPQLIGLKGGNSENIFQLNLANGLPMSLLGLPIIVTEKIPALGTKGDVMLANFSFYLVGDRNDTRVEWSSHVKFLEDQLALKVVDRIDGQPWLASPYTPRKGTALSPFVVLN